MSLLSALAMVIALPACNDDGSGDDEVGTEGDGDGDGDPGDGDGDPGDGDGDPGDGDGDPGDGDGDPGDGDGDPGDGDGDPGDGDGDPGDGDGDPGDGDGDPGGLSFEADVYPIIQANCSCHFAGSGGLSMPDAATAYGNLVDVPSVHDPDLDRVEPGDAQNSFLYQKIAGVHDGISPGNAQMPKTVGMAMSATPLSADDMATIEGWINDGAAP